MPLNKNKKRKNDFTVMEGEMVESYRYDAYGNTHVFNAEGVEIERSAIGNSRRWRIYGAGRKQSDWPKNTTKKIQRKMPLIKKTVIVGTISK